MRITRMKFFETIIIIDYSSSSLNLKRTRIKKQSNRSKRHIDFKIFMESLILAQNERWRHGLGMQVERL